MTKRMALNPETGERFLVEVPELQRPSIGRIVHYIAYGTPNGEYKPEHRAAIITAVVDADRNQVCLCVINPTGLFFNLNVSYDESRQVSGSWHWPERV